MTPIRSLRQALALTAAVLAAPVFAAQTDASPVDPRQQQSAALAAELGAALKARLSAAIAEGGALQAVGVCQLEAPTIAAGLSASSGAVVGRTALRVRNPANAPQAWQTRVLKQFEQQLADGQPPQPVFERFADGSARFAAPIMTFALCTQCHGKALEPTLAARIQTLYPMDQATGFAEGELRGMFSVLWPAPVEEDPPKP